MDENEELIQRIKQGAVKGFLRCADHVEMVKLMISMQKALDKAYREAELKRKFNL